jgi:hypothetical protein
MVLVQVRGYFEALRALSDEWFVPVPCPMIARASIS